MKPWNEMTADQQQFAVDAIRREVEVILNALATDVSNHMTTLGFPFRCAIRVGIEPAASNPQTP